MERKEITIDAARQSLGRLAADISVKLRGKDCPGFTYSQDQGPRITVINIDKIVLTGKKMLQKKYLSYSGYPGGLKTTLAKNTAPAQLLRHAVMGMLPKNRLRDKMIKRLTIK